MDLDPSPLSIFFSLTILFHLLPTRYFQDLIKNMVNKTWNLWPNKSIKLIIRILLKL